MNKQTFIGEGYVMLYIYIYSYTYNNLQNLIPPIPYPEAATLETLNPKRQWRHQV